MLVILEVCVRHKTQSLLVQTLHRRGLTGCGEDEANTNKSSKSIVTQTEVEGECDATK
jgi:hypothetical protein